MEIANPIYDVVFKYLMEDQKVAKIFLSTLTELNIVSLELMPQELSSERDKGQPNRLTKFNFSVYRLDFSAKIVDNDGSQKVIIIEIQKSKFANESMRFRKYLGKQYMNGSYFMSIEDAQGRSYKSGVPILSIYFLGERIHGFDNCPVLKINTSIIDRFSKTILTQRHNFVDALFHEGIIVNIPALNKKRRDEIETLLSIFDQENRHENHHIMNVQELDFPENLRPIIRRLQAAVTEEELREIMIVEDDFISEIQEYEDRILESKKAIEKFDQKAQEADQKAQEANQKAQEADQKAQEANQKAQEANQKAQEADQKAQEAMRRQVKAIKLLLGSGLSKLEVATSLEISLLELDRMLNSYEA